MLRIAILILINLFLLGCKKKDNKPFVYLEMQVVGSSEVIKWEELEGSWSEADRSVRLKALSFDFHQLYLNLDNITDTSTITSLTVAEVKLTDAKGFNSTRVANGYVRITSKSFSKISGEFNLELEGSQITKLKRITGKFDVINKP